MGHGLLRLRLVASRASLAHVLALQEEALIRAVGIVAGSAPQIDGGVRDLKGLHLLAHGVVAGEAQVGLVLGQREGVVFGGVLDGLLGIVAGRAHADSDGAVSEASFL